ncbi:hypothetical protein Y1Q_0011253 [Alligator mississippiensis]|uniref:Uncharacterized protein n=1 Tax=Alligator mississippiensis TaxID=8496 RepID=A0A151N7W8_ALLMI|nr:hypothetical protein Y1Q_0011253 [Alligator mississippiensis]
MQGSLAWQRRMWLEGVSESKQKEIWSTFECTEQEIVWEYASKMCVGLLPVLSDREKIGKLQHVSFTHSPGDEQGKLPVHSIPEITPWDPELDSINIQVSCSCDLFH